MIDEVDDGLRALLLTEAVPDGEVDVAFDAPTTEWAARRTASTINVFLYDLREDAARRRPDPMEEFAEDGVTIIRREPPRWIRLSYLISVWAGTPRDEHRLLSAVLSCLLRHDELPDRHLSGGLARLGLGLPLDAAGPLAENRSAAEVWTALGGELKAAVDLRVLAPLAGARTATTRPVTDGRLLGGHDTTADPESTRIRRLRYQDLAEPDPVTPPAADPDGIGAPRPRSSGRSRRRRGGRLR